jgi:hypothetical protein
MTTRWFSYALKFKLPGGHMSHHHWVLGQFW